ncbi:divergent polysaccharide deacetylase family protein [Roseovarius salinarum]|uniref:divergent polysaccharide deacetylase family protein n=1 Tax=Roseovarius salinarum TaxID=1981892 RepID=UPI001E5BD730|nr:divergent polysaccharide deacetylase family protein [Roseovarius salinarum]
MARGFIGGIVTGVLVAGIAGGTASLLTEIPQTASPEAGVPEVPAGSEFDRPRDDEAADLPTPEDAPEPGQAPAVAPPEPDDLAALEGADTDPAARPETAEPEAEMAPATGGEAESGVAVEGESPVLPSPQAAAPEVPEEEGELSISTDPAQPPMPDETGEPSAFPDRGTGDAGQEADATPPERDAEGQPDDTGDEAAAAQRDTAPDAAAPEVETEAPSGTIGDLAADVETDRLPSVTDDDAVVDPAEDTKDAGALTRHAADFSNPAGKPLMSIVLIDDGDSPIGLEALESFPYAVSFALDPTDEGAQQAMRRYRDAGFEVLALADLPQGASARDVEVAMQSLLSDLPEAVAVMEGTGTGLDVSQAARKQLAPILRETGHGLVMFPEGLDTAAKLIARDGVPTATVFRDFDSKGQEADVIRRFLDQAAFKARQENGVIMVGRLRAETVSALLLWGLQDRASQVALAPISAVLRARAE